MTNDERRSGGGHEVDHSAGNARTVRAADENVTPATAHNLAIWVFLGLLIAAILVVAVGALAS